MESGARWKGLSGKHQEQEESHQVGLGRGHHVCPLLAANSDHFGSEVFEALLKYPDLSGISDYQPYLGLFQLMREPNPLRILVTAIPSGILGSDHLHQAVRTTRLASEWTRNGYQTE